MRIVVPWGFYGWGNIGDEGTLKGFAQLLTQTGVRATVTLGSRNPAHTAAVEPMFRYFEGARPDPRRWIAKLRASSHAFVGGTPIMDVLGEWPLCDVRPLVLGAVRRKLPVVFVGVGIEGLRLDASVKIMKEDITPHVLSWSVRSQKDQQRLLGVGVPPERITVAADMAWLVNHSDGAFGATHLKALGVDTDRPLIGVNLVNENDCFDRQPRLGQEIAHAIDRLSDELDAHVIFLAQEVRDEPGFDRAAAMRVAGLMARKDRVTLVPNTYFSPNEVMSILEHCDLTIGMRYHFCIFSALQRVPFIAIQRSDKLLDLCWDMNWHAGVTPATLTASAIVEEGIRLQRESARTAAHLDESVQRMKTRALFNAAPLNALTDGVATADTLLGAWR